MGPRAGPDILEKSKYFVHARNRNPYLPARSLVTTLNYENRIIIIIIIIITHRFLVLGENSKGSHNLLSPCTPFLLLHDSYT
jgi:hypothetical protein